jgi:DNA processing protein
MVMTRTEAYLILNSLKHVGPVRVRKLLEVLGSVEVIFGTSGSKIASIDGIGQKVADSIKDWEKQFDLDAELKKIEQMKITVLDCEDERYPAMLSEIYDPPLVLYTQGNIEALNKKSIGVVGSRRTTYYGIETAKKLSYQMAYAGMVVTSGLARGIDTAAHQGAVAAEGPTIAVLGSAIDELYPAENRSLYEKILDTNGTVISEFTLGTKPDKQTFPMRNRIISGLSNGILVVEAPVSSGSMITARMAGEQGRQVFAIPGRIDSPLSKGCHQLIKEGAKLVEEVEDILSEFSELYSTKEVKSERPIPENLTPEETAILQALTGDESHLDELSEKSGLPTGVVSFNLLRLEMRKLVRQLPGKYFIKTY